MSIKKFIKKYLSQLLVSTVIVSTATTGYFVYETITTNNALNALQEQYDALLGENASLSFLIEQIESLNDKLNTDLVDLNKQLDDLELIRDNLIIEVEGLEEDKTELNLELDKVNEEIKTLQAGIASLNSQVAASAAALGSLSSQNSQLSGQISILNSQLNSLNSELNSLNIQLNSFVLENASQIDFAKVNTISQSAIKANVRVIVPVSGATAFGSGIVYKYTSTGNKYFVLTNNHVIEDHVLGNGSITVESYNGSVFNAVLRITVPNSDLAILEVSGTNSTDFSVLQLEPSSYVLANDTNVISMGGPRLQYNTITLGKVTNNNTNITVTDDKSYSGVISHTAVINQGSSGGALINFDLKIVGINFAGLFEGNPSLQPYPFTNVNGYAIDLARIYSIIGTGETYSLP
jgi:S1-C subfamily serine protease